MARVVSIGAQDFEMLITNNCFYVDKTLFIKEWWESYDIVTLITRPRRFGKTLNMNMLERFFSIKYREQGTIFEGLNIWEEKSPDGDYKYRDLQGTYPVISLSFAGVKEPDYDMAVYRLCGIIQDLYIKNYFLLQSDVLTEGEKNIFKRMADDMDVKDAPVALHRLSYYLSRHYDKKVIILLDEYDAPMQEAFVSGYWEKMVSFTRNLFNNTFKTNPYLERAVMTGITRVSKESMFSDLNNLNVVTTTSDEYASCFGFTEDEVFFAMDEFNLTNKNEVKEWYDGFTIGNVQDIYNPWSIINFLSKKKLDIYWANTSSNGLVSRLVQKGNAELKVQFERLLQRQSIITELDEEIVFDQLDIQKAGEYDNMREIKTRYLPPDTVLGDRYVVGRVIGQGSFGITYIGRDTLFDSVVAVKEYFPAHHVYRNVTGAEGIMVCLYEDEEQSEYKQMMGKFLDEAKRLSQFREVRGIVSVRDFFFENNTAYMVMEYVEGVSLKKYVEKHGPMKGEWVLTHMDPLMDALEKIHETGLIHRDISPDNIIVKPDSSLELIDFGSARETNTEKEKSLTVVFKRGFSLAEQYRARGEQGIYTDVYAVCATMYFCLTGTVPDEALERIFVDETPSLLSMPQVELSRRQKKAVMKGISVRAKERYSSIRELRMALKEERWRLSWKNFKRTSENG